MLRTCVVILLFLGGVAWADVYTVRSVQINEQSANESLAKQQGLKAAEAEAFRRLVRRLVPRADWDRVPVLDEDTLQKTVQTWSIEDEKFGQGVYLAHITVQFNPRFVRFLMQSAKVPLAETQSQPILILPIDGEGFSWEDNPWLEAWTSTPLPAEDLVPLKLPQGDSLDRSILTTIDPHSLSLLAQKYGVSGTVVVWRTQDHVQVSFSIPGWEATPLNLATQGSLTEVAAQVKERIEEVWKNKNLVLSQDTHTLTFAFQASSVKAWVLVAKTLHKVSVIKKVTLRHITNQEVVATLTFVGEVGQLSTALRQKGLHLLPLPDRDVWVLYRG